MGLDQHIYKMNKEKFKTYQELVKEFNEIECEDEEDCRETELDEILFNYIEESDEILYWRKANWFHYYFLNKTNTDYDFNSYDAVELTKELLEDLIKSCTIIYDEFVKYDSKYGSIDNQFDEKYSMKKEEKLQLKQLEEIIESHDLTPRSGFFFGSTAISSWYFENIFESLEKFQEILEETNFDEDIIYYTSSW